MKLYFAPHTRALRIAWLLEELGLPYALERFALGDPAMRDPRYRAVHPMGRVPALEDGDVTLFESGAIVQYLLARHGNGRLHPAADAPEFPAYLQWLHYAEGMIMPHVNIVTVETILLPPDRRNEVNVKRARKLLTQMLGAVNDRLTDHDHLAGDFTAADIMTGHAVIGAVRSGADVSDLPHIQPYIDRLTARPALERALAL